MVIGLMALAIFVVFAVVGGVIVWLIVSKENERGTGDQRPRGFRDDADPPA